MSDETPDSKVASIMGGIFLFIVPIVMIVMLGIVGMEFLRHTGPEAQAEPAKQEAPVASAPAPPTEPADTTADANPAEPAPDAEPPTETLEIDPEVMALGKTSYATCAACHGPDGKGIKAGPALMAPSLVGSEVLLGDPDLSLLVVLKGIQKQNMDYMGVMAPLAAALDDKKLAAVLTYTRNTWGNSAPAVTEEQAAEAREKFSSLDAPAGVPRGDIEKIVAEHK